jgi:hypothetical protein
MYHQEWGQEFSTDKDRFTKQIKIPTALLIFNG